MRHGCDGDEDATDFGWFRPDAGAGRGDLCRGRAGGGVCHSGIVSTIGRGRSEAQPLDDAQQTFGHGAGLREAARKGSPQETPGGKERSSRQSPQTTPANRQAGRASSRGLSRLSRPAPALCRDADPDHRRDSRNRAGGHRAYNSSRLVPFLQKESRAGSARCPAGIDLGQQSAGAFGLAALLLGQHALADCQSLWFSPAVSPQPRRADCDVATAAGDSFRLVPRNSKSGPRFGRAARRRNRLAG